MAKNIPPEGGAALGTQDYRAEQTIAEMLKPFVVAWRRQVSKAGDFLFGDNDKDLRIAYLYLGTKREDLIAKAHQAFGESGIPTRTDKRAAGVLIIAKKHFAKINATSVADAVTFLQEHPPLGLPAPGFGQPISQPQR
jgi:hypothetical protein